MPKLRKIKNIKKNTTVIIIVIIILIILLLAGSGVGLYYYLDKTKILQEETNNKVRDIIIQNLPSIFYNNTVPKCDSKSCLLIGQTIILDQLLTSTSKINNIIIKKTLSSEELTEKLQIYSEESIISTKESSEYYLLLFNTYANVYRYINLNNDSCKLVSNGFQCGNKIINFFGYKCIINNKIFFCDLTYINKDLIILCDSDSIPQGVISKDDLIYLSDNKKVERYILTNISSILITNYSILVLNKENKLIGILSIL